MFPLSVLRSCDSERYSDNKRETPYKFFRHYIRVGQTYLSIYTKNPFLLHFQYLKVCRASNMNVLSASLFIIKSVCTCTDPSGMRTRKLRCR
jgi:hypothetical protein